MNPVTVLAELLAPARCPGCGTRAAPPWCRECATAVRLVDPADACRCCGLADARSRDGHGCWPPDGPVAASVTPFVYAGPVAAAVVAAKAAGAWSLWAPLGAALAAVVAAADPSRAVVEVVVPVPTDRRRARMRGVDHTLVLARAVARDLGLPLLPALVVRAGRPDQGERPIDLRRAVPLEAFRPARPLACGRALLVDDVLTTGGTAWSAAAALRRAGAGQVVVGAVARAGRHALGPLPQAPPSGRSGR